jgi:hypothetical protein
MNDEELSLDDIDSSKTDIEFKLVALDDGQTQIEFDLTMKEILDLFCLDTTTIPFELKKKDDA